MVYEIILTRKLGVDDFDKLIRIIMRYNQIFKSIKICMRLENNKLSYFLQVPFKIPVSMSNLEGFLFKESQKDIPKSSIALPIWLDYDSDFLELKTELEIKKGESLNSVQITFIKFKKNKTFSTSILTTESGRTYQLMLCNPGNILAVDFENNKNYTKSGTPKYLNILKSLPLFGKNVKNSLLKVDSFPYSSENLYLATGSYDFSNHSVIFGSSGSGKSKFVSLFVSNILKNNENKYRFVIIDPHAALEEEIGGLGRVIDFKNKNSIVDMFKGGRDVVSDTEQLLDLFKSEMSSYNPKLERVLRYSIYLLVHEKCFNFQNLRKLITDLEFRNDLVKKSTKEVPYTITNFFLVDFNELKTKSYGDTISPIISFLDEMELLPAFRNTETATSLEEMILENSMTLFSLDNKVLGSTGVRMLSGLIMQKLFSLIQNREFDSKIIFIIDEVSIVERSILTKYLSEARKYNLGLILMGQYFSQITDSLKSAIFANVQNYYIFKVSKSDANLLVDNLNIKLEGNHDREKTINFLTDLNMRELVVKVMKEGKDISPFKGKTLDYIGRPRIVERDEENTIEQKSTNEKISFRIESVDLKNLMKKNSTRRKPFYE